MTKKLKMPFQVWILTLSAFAIGTAEFVIAGLLTQIAEDLAITEGQAGHLITAYAMAIVIGGPILTLWLVRFDRRSVLVGLMGLFVVGNLISAFSENYMLLLISRIVSGLTQGPFYGIGAVVATGLVSEHMKGQAVGQMFAGLTLANVLGVPGGSWIGLVAGWDVTFLVVASLGIVAGIAILFAIPHQPRERLHSVREQLKAFGEWNLLASLAFTILAWTGFMTFYGYIAPIAEQVADFERVDVTWILVIVGIGLVVGNFLGGKTADSNLRLSLILWPLGMIITLVVAGFVAPYKWPFLIVAFIFGVMSFANVPSMQMRVMKYGKQAPELSATANISAFNVANALGGIIGAFVIDGSLGAGAIPYAAAIIPLLGVLFIVNQENRPNNAKQST